MRGAVQRMGGDVAVAASTKGALDQESAGECSQRRGGVVAQPPTACTAAQARVEREEAAQALHILRQSSRINGLQVSLCSDADSSGSGSPAPRPQLSDEQLAFAARWEAPHVDPHASTSAPADNQQGLLIEQGISADCSFIAAMSVCLAHNAKRDSRLGMDLLQPLSGGNIADPASRYRAKLHINGDWRKVGRPGYVRHGDLRLSDHAPGSS